MKFVFLLAGFLLFPAGPVCFAAEAKIPANAALDQKIQSLFAEFDRSGKETLDLMGDGEYRKVVMTKLKEDSKRQVNYDVGQSSGNPFEFFDLDYNR